MDNFFLNEDLILFKAVLFVKNIHKLKFELKKYN